MDNLRTPMKPLAEMSIEELQDMMEQRKKEALLSMLRPAHIEQVVGRMVEEVIGAYVARELGLSENPWIRGRSGEIELKGWLSTTSPIGIEVKRRASLLVQSLPESPLKDEEMKEIAKRSHEWYKAHLSKELSKLASAEAQRQAAELIGKIK
jgi:hypothetical protein